MWIDGTDRTSLKELEKQWLLLAQNVVLKQNEVASCSKQETTEAMWDVGRSAAGGVNDDVIEQIWQKPYTGHQYVPIMEEHISSTVLYAVRGAPNVQ